MLKLEELKSRVCTLEELKSRACTLEELQECFVKLAEQHNGLVHKVFDLIRNSNEPIKERTRYGL